MIVYIKTFNFTTALRDFRASLQWSEGYLIISLVTTALAKNYVG
jgi:hypothetical protein